jgi:hypothetical protein
MLFIILKFDKTEKMWSSILENRERIYGDNELHNNWDVDSEKGLGRGE